MLPPMLLAIYHGEIKACWSFVYTIALVCPICGLYALLTKKNIDVALSIKDGFLFVTSIWVFVSVVGALPYFLSGTIPTYTDSFFETMSGFTTTGASILSNIEGAPKSILLWRAMTHWLGGMGIVVLAVAILPALGVGGLQLIKAGASSPDVDRLVPRITETAKILWGIYLLFTIILTLLLIFGGMTLYDALTQAFSTISTGGFSTKNSSIASFRSPYIEWVLTIFMFLSAINLAVYFRLATGKSLTVFRGTELKAYALIVFAAVLIISINLYLSGIYTSIEACARYAGFQVVSIITTTGFATADYGMWPFFSQGVCLLLFFIGGCSGSTSGGIKVIRVVTLLKQGLNEMKRLLHPHGVFILKINHRAVENNVIASIAGFFFLYIALVLIVAIVVAASGQSIETSLTAALATQGGVGIAFGKIGALGDYSFFDNHVKWVLSFAMLLGRLELYTVLILFTPRFWRK